MALTGRAGLLALLGALVVGLAAPGWRGIALVEGALAIGVAVDLAVAGSVRRLRFERTGDVAARLGETAEVSLRIANPGRRQVRGMLRDAWPPSAGARQDRHPVRIPAGERRVVRTVLLPTRRGDRVASRVTVRSVGPLGLAARQGSHLAPWQVRVLPPFLSRRQLPAKVARLRELDGQVSVLTRGQGTEFDSLRDYVVGDDVRSIDWRATARQQTVMVRTWRPERDRHVVLVLDTGRTSAGRIGDAPRLDAAMDAALLLAALASRAGDRVDLLAFDQRVRASVTNASRADLLPSLVNALAGVEPELVELDAAGLASALARRTTRRSLIVLLTTLDEAPVAQGLLPVLPMLCQRHVVVLASVADPRLAELAAGRGDIAAVYEAASAEKARSARRAVADRLARLGVTVVDAPPAELPGQLADAYLALKAAGRL